MCVLNVERCSMIANIKFKSQYKITGLKAEHVSFYCGCKCLKIETEADDVDALVDLCVIHEEMQKKLDKGEIKPEDAVIPQARIQM